MPKIKLLLQKESPPSVLVIHLGGNDMPSTPTHRLEKQIKQDLAEIRVLMPRTHIVWSDLTARLRYRHARDHSKVDKTRKAINYKIHVTVCQLGGSFVRHPNLTCDNTKLYRHDGVHLSNPGTDILLQNWQVHLYDIITYTLQ